jgi:sugar transferase EpsL
MTEAANSSERHKFAYPAIKRWIDAICAALALVLLSPPVIVVALLVRLVHGSPILFRQLRPGRNEKLFECLKFRTMTNARDERGELLSDEARLTWLGRSLRKLSLDELPQLWNILRGQLSFIGPRPLLTEYLPHYTEEEHRRHSVRPGLTGWAQVHGRNTLTFDERLRFDIWYVDNQSWRVDLEIFARTIHMLLTRRGTDLVTFPALHVQRSVRTAETKFEA